MSGTARHALAAHTEGLLKEEEMPAETASIHAKRKHKRA
jgi:hypothetical protein